MIKQLLLDEFDRITSASDAIPRLRQFIVELAVRGKLDSQDDNADSIDKLVRSVRTGTRRFSERKKGLAPFEQNEIPYRLPDNWKWMRLGDVLELVNGRAFKPTDWLRSGLPIVRIQNLNDESAPFNHCDESTVEARHIIDSGAFLISWSGTPGTSFGAFIWKRGKAALNQHIFSCFQIGNAYYDRFLQLAINGRLDEMIAKAHGGVGLQHITKGKLENLPICLPPYSEQQRIVDKVDELLALCDRLGAAQEERQTRCDELTLSTYDRLFSSPNGVIPTQAASFFVEHLPDLTARPYQIDLLRRSILNFAARGKLVPQNPSDTPASELLSEIRSEQRLLNRPRVKSEEQSRKADDPFEIPGGWVWTTLEQLVVFGPQNGISPPPSSRPDAPRALTLSATTKGRFDARFNKGVEASVPMDSELWLKPGDLLFQRGNTREYVGMAAYYDGEPGRFLYPDLMIKVRLSEKVDLRFVHFYAISPAARAYLSSSATGAQSTMPKINQGVLSSMPVPLPPASEQRRIVERVDELMLLCEQLEEHLRAAQAGSSFLLDSVLHLALKDNSVDEFNAQQLAI